jgi:hypothetical protein
MNYLSTTAGNPGSGGYAFAYQDTGGSVVCLDGCPQSVADVAPACAVPAATAELCTHGTLGANPAPYSVYGGGIGINLNQVMGATAVGTFAATGSGIGYAVTSVPTNGLRIQIDHGGMTYCAPVTATTGTIPWANFAITCYNTPPGAALTGPPNDATQIEFQMVTVATAGSGDFCVTSLLFAP